MIAYEDDLTVRFDVFEMLTDYSNWFVKYKVNLTLVGWRNGEQVQDFNLALRKLVLGIKRIEVTLRDFRVSLDGAPIIAFLPSFRACVFELATTIESPSLVHHCLAITDSPSSHHHQGDELFHGDLVAASENGSEDQNSTNQVTPHVGRDIVQSNVKSN
ncbi:hypothetical protein LguiA_025912 [Lonicera macranthoides]